MKTIDPNYMMELIPIAHNTPKRIRWMVRMLKGLKLFGDANFKTDRDVFIEHFFNWHNNHSPQVMLWNIKISKETVALLYDDAVRWIGEVENA